MMRGLGFVIFAFPAFMALGQSKIELPAPLQRSVSSSQQFIVYHSDRALRSRLAQKVEDLKAGWLRRLRIDDQWKSPIIVQIIPVRRSNAPRMRTSLYESDGGELKVQIDVYDTGSLKTADFDLEVYRALFLEYGYRNLPAKAGKSFHQPPAWLIDGLFEDVAAREEGIAVGLYARLINEESSPKLDLFLKQRPEMLDATSRAIYRARALGLLRALLRTPDGSKHLAEYCSSLPSIDPTDSAGLLRAFPTLSEKPATLSKLWTLCLAEASASNRVLPMSTKETQKRLSLILEITAQKDPKKRGSIEVRGPEALLAAARTNTGRYVVRQKAEELLQLEVRAHPLMRPIIEEYRTIASELASKPKKNFETRIRKNMQLQAAVVQRTEEMEDYLNWFEAAQLSTPSKEFETAVDPQSGTLSFHRDDTLSRYLDDIEARGW
ncbi:MAG TPA: hypothetical protein VIS99_00215 [Terrimicrobiaceae bacterium]